MACVKWTRPERLFGDRRALQKVAEFSDFKCANIIPIGVLRSGHPFEPNGVEHLRISRRTVQGFDRIRELFDLGFIKSRVISKSVGRIFWTCPKDAQLRPHFGIGGFPGADNATADILDALRDVGVDESCEFA